MASIRQDARADALPDFRNLGITARILIAANLLALAVVFAAVPGWLQALDAFVRMAAILEPTLVAALVVLYIVAPWLARMPYWRGCAAVLALVLALVAAVHASLAEAAAGDLGRALALAAAATV
ncbi:MAG: hypothetical protein ACREUO_07910, partial [Burkholderiales bacterium]